MNDFEEPPGGKKHPQTIIYIANMSEDVWPFISAISDPVSRQSEIDENAALSDRDLFALSGENHIIFISPRSVSEEFAQYFKGLFGIRNFEAISTRDHTGEICRDVLKDNKIISKIEKAANSSRRITLLSYSTSHQFLNLANYLRNRGITVVTPEAPDEKDGWTVNFYGSKSGIRQMAQKGLAQEPDLLMPEGVICVNIIDASRIAARWYLKHHGIVIKTNKGHSGAGLLIFRPGDLPLDFAECEKIIYKHIAKDSYWNMFPIVVEEYINVNTAIAGGFPNVEFKISRNGHIDFLYFCGLRVTRDGVFKGIEINNDVIGDKIQAQIIDTGFFIAERFSAEGYRGYFDVDYVAGKNGKMYVTEANTRRTGGTHVYHTVETLFGKDFMYETYTLSNNIYDLPNRQVYLFSRIHDQLEPVLYDKKTKEGLIIVSESMLSRGQLGYIIFGRNKKRALEIESKMEELLGGL